MDEQKPKRSKSTKKLVDDSLITKGVDQNVQQMINRPQTDPTGTDEKDKEFVTHVMKLIEEGKIDLYRPETLMNKKIYESLDEKTKGKADINAIPLLGEIRTIKSLYETGNTESYQIKNLIQRVRLYKERIEKECGDVYII